MTTRPIRLVHASDLRLDTPLHGLAHAPDHLRELLREGPRLAAERVFDTVLTEEADALLLAGDVVDLKRAAPRDVVFLVDQFRRLEKRGVSVFWAGGVIDPPEAWPRTLPLPSNVAVFPVGRVEEHTLARDGAPIAAIQGVSKPGDATVDASGFRREPGGLFTIGVAFGTSDAPGKEGDRVDYMALGGRARRATVDHEPGIAHYSGSPQGRSPREAGPSGCTVVQLEEGGKAKTRFVATDLVRWQEESIEFTSGTTEEELRRRLRERLDKVSARSKGVDQLVAWRLHGVGPLLPELRDDGLCRRAACEDLQKSRQGRQQPDLLELRTHVAIRPVRAAARTARPRDDPRRPAAAGAASCGATRRSCSTSSEQLAPKPLPDRFSLSKIAGDRRRGRPRRPVQSRRKAGRRSDDRRGLSLADAATPGRVPPRPHRPQALSLKAPMKLTDLHVDGFGVWHDLQSPRPVARR